MSSPHAQHYVPEKPPLAGAHTAAEMIQADARTAAAYFGGVCVITAIAALFPFILHAGRPAPEGEVPHQAQALINARIEGFRAGYETAARDACSGPALSSPIAKP